MLDAARAVLQEHWGYPDFRPAQAEVIEAVLAGRDVMAVLPTGGGKSICYQVPALMGEGLTLVVSPLIALMQDQVAGLQARGISAAFINSTLRRHEVDQRWTDAEFGRYRLLYVAPERFQTDVFAARAERLNVQLLAVDEAHCISEWGHHFRPAYLQIAEARSRLGGPRTLAVTATATPEVRRDIIDHLALRDPQVLVRGFDRPNITWSIFREEDKRGMVRDVVQAVDGSGLLYAATRRGTEQWANWLTKQGEPTTAYHGGLPTSVRTGLQEAWIAGEQRVMVATNAFGMGIDKPDVRFVIHVDLPATLEGYYQEAGRAGRDGERSYAVLLFQPQDEATQRSLIEQGHPDAAAVRAVYDAVCNLAQLPLGSAPEGPVGIDMDAVMRLTGLGRGAISTAIELLIRQDTWQGLPDRRHHALFRFQQPADALRRYAERLDNRALAAFLETLMRTVHAEAYTDWWDVDLRRLRRATQLTDERLARGLDFLQGQALLQWRPTGRSRQVFFAEPRTQRLPVDDRAVRRARRRADARLNDMLRYARSVSCRRHFLLSYFGEHSPETCGQCDVCVGRHRAVVITPADEPVLRRILQQVADGAAREAWFTSEDAPPARHLDGLIDWLIQEAYLVLDDPLAERFALTEKAHVFLEQWSPRQN